MARFRIVAGIVLAVLCAPVCAADLIRVVNEGGIRDEWTLPPGSRLALPAYPVAYAAQPAEACVAIGYLVNADGSTSDFTLLKNWTSAKVPSASQQVYWAAFAQESAQALSQWRFQPRAEVQSPRPVYTVATLLFAASSPQLRTRCAIPNLSAHLLELRQDSSVRRKMTSGLFDRLDLDPLRSQREVERPRTVRDQPSRFPQGR